VPDSRVPELLRQAEQGLRDGRTAAAAAAYRKALALEPGLADAWFNLAWLHRAERDFSAALDAYGHAIAAGVDRPEDAHVNRAAILSDHLYRSDEAEAELRAALALNECHLPAWLGLGTLFEDLGRREDARAAYTAALRWHPGNGRALARLATLDTLSGHAALAAASLHRALPGATAAEDRADLLFALGGALDAAADYDTAWQAYEAANHYGRSVATVRYDRAAQQTLVDRLIATLPEPRKGAPAADGPTPIFICGMFRSGSTLAEQILGRHPAIEAHGEIEAVPAIAARLQPYPEALLALTPARSALLRDEYLAELGPVAPTAHAFTDKRCDNVLHVGLIKALFPDARIVETIREPLDNLLSAWFLRFGDAVTYAHDLGDLTHYYLQQRRLMAHWRRLYPAEIRAFDYDAAVRDPRTEVGGLLAWLGLPWDEACLAQGAAAGVVRTASAWQVRQPLHPRSSGRWRHYRDHLVQVKAALDAAGV
jgi:tetratricopeptide (TPR) repeat protein